MPNKIDSNVTGLSFAEESTTIGVLPGTPDWYELCPNSYNEFGGEVSNVARNCIDASRQRKKGTIVDLDASGGFNIDITQKNLERLMQGFFFADAREKAATQPLNGTQVTITNVDTTLDTYDAASGLDVFKANDLILASGFTNAGNNGLKTVTAVTAADVTVSENLTNEAAPPAASKLEVVGYQFATGDLTITASASLITLGTTIADFTTMALNVGEYVFIGGDAAGNVFDTVSAGYARIVSIAANALVIDEPTFTAATDTGTGKDMQMFFGSVLRNEDVPANIKRRSYNLERTLGDDGVGTQSEYLEGAVPNELTLNMPQADKLNADLTFVATDNTQRTGTEGVKSGNRISALNEDAFNTSSDLYRTKLSINDPNLASDTDLFAYVSEANIAINNNLTPTKALGVLGAFDITAGDFEVSGSITAYFATVSAVQAVRNNSDVAFNVIAASQNAGLVFDLPLIALGDGRVNVEKDSPITIPLETNAAENDNGYTMMMVNFSYLPTVAMPS